MKLMIEKTIMLCMILCMAISFSGCGSDSDEPEVPKDPNKITKVTIDYAVELSQDYYDLWDIEVAYIGAGGKKVTETIDMDWHMRMTLSTSDEIPAEYMLSVVANPKTTVPTVDPEKVYTLESSCMVSINGYSADGKNIMQAGMLTPQHHKVDTDGEHLKEIIKKDRPICDVKYTVKNE